MTNLLTLDDLLYERLTGILNRYKGAWLVWCDAQGHWLPLLKQVTAAHHIPFIVVQEHVRGAIGGLQWRRTLQERIERGESFVLYVQASKEQLGWLWAQALRAEERIERPLREQLYEWGWRSQNIAISDQEVMWLARTNLHQSPTLWGGGGLQSKPERLLELLATNSKVALYTGDGTANDDSDTQQTTTIDPILTLTIDSVGLPPLDVQLDDDGIKRWCRYALVRLLVTQAQEVAPSMLSNHEYLIDPPKRDEARKLLTQWTDSIRLSKGLAGQILEVDRIAMLHNYLGTLNVTARPFLSYAAERTIFANSCTHLAQLPPHELLTTLAEWTPLFERHAQAFWGDQRQYRQGDLSVPAIPWHELYRLGQAASELLAAHPSEWSTPMEAVRWYTDTGWHVERAGEAMLRQTKQATSELLTLLEAVRNAYRARWEEYMIRWSNLWTATGCPMPQLSSQGEWLLPHLKGSQPTAVLVIDALRYDIAMSLKEQINRDEGFDRAYVGPARSALPSITALGMGMALPVKEQDLRAEVVNGSWQLYHKDATLNLSIAANRREWLRTQLKVSADALLQLSEVTKERIPPTSRKRLFLFDDAIDKLGHDEELEPLGTDEIQRRYYQIITLLHECGWSRILVVTDHGFIHWAGSAEQRVAPPAPDPVYTSRRALAYPPETQFVGPQGFAPGGQWRIAVAGGAGCFRTYGSLGYFHGGASLQEWIVPCMRIEWPAAALPVHVTIVHIDKILSLRAKIELEVQHTTLIDDTLARQIIVKVLNATTKQQLFSSQPQFVTPKEDRIFVQIEPLPDVEAERGTPLLIEVRDARNDEFITQETTTLMVPIENW